MFRRILNLEEFFEDHRTLSYILINVNKYKTISDLEERIKSLFAINEPISLFENGVLLPSLEDIEIITLSSETLTVKKLSVLRSPSTLPNEVENKENEIHVLNNSVSEIENSVSLNSSKGQKRKKGSYDRENNVENVSDGDRVDCGETSHTDLNTSERKRKKCKKSKKQSKENTKCNQLANNDNCSTSSEFRNMLNLLQKVIDENTKECNNLDSAHEVNDLERVDPQINCNMQNVESEGEPVDNNHVNEDFKSVKTSSEVNDGITVADDGDSLCNLPTRKKRKRSRKRNVASKKTLGKQCVNEIKYSNSYSNFNNSTDNLQSSTHIRFDCNKIPEQEVEGRSKLICKVEAADNIQLDSINDSEIGRLENEDIPLTQISTSPAKTVSDVKNVTELVSNGFDDHVNRLDNASCKSKSNSNDNDTAWFNGLMKVKQESDMPPVFVRKPKNAIKDVNGLKEEDTNSQQRICSENGVSESIAKHTLEVDDIVIFKILILAEDYSPTVSDSVIGRVRSVSETLINLNILKGRNICKRLTGKFSLNDADGHQEDGEENDTVELFIKDLIEPKKVKNPFDVYNTSSDKKFI